MARRRHHLPLLIAFAAATIAVGITDRAAGAHVCHEETVTTIIQGEIHTSTKNVCPAHDDNTGADPVGDHSDAPSGGPSACAQMIELLGLPDDYCEVFAPIGGSSGGGLTPAVIQQAFNRMRLPASKLIIQPPKGKTLINFETNFYTRRSPIQRSITLLGRRIHFRITADQFTWHFGDGTKKTTRTPGAPYPDLLVTHNYRKKGLYRPSLDTTYVADFRVGNGAWRSVTGSVTISGEPQRLRAIGAKPVLTSPYGPDD